MISLTIYMEGGGDSNGQLAQLRTGMDRFLTPIKDRFREKHWRWKLIPCGGRRSAYDKFSNAMKNQKPGEKIILLVDAEAPITESTRTLHLEKRPGDGWDLSGVSEDHIHLMAQSMEAWIVADPEALSEYYGQNFLVNKLPVRQNLEEEPKVDCAAKLADATRNTQKGEYKKIKHAAELLGKISSAKVRERCPHAETLFSTLNKLI